MKLRDALGLHNGDEVTLKNTGESIKVLSTDPRCAAASRRIVLVVIEGVGTQSGYGIQYLCRRFTEDLDRA